MGWLMAVNTILQLLPELIKTVKLVVRELDSDDTPGIGAEKKEFAMGVIKAGITAAGELCPDHDTQDTLVQDMAMAVASKVIDKQVAFDKSVDATAHIAAA